MTKTYNILADFDRSQYVLTGTFPLSFQDASRNDPLDLGTEEAATRLFNSLDAGDLAAAGWKGYHNVTLTLVEYGVDAEDEVVTRYLAEKKITVDTVAK